MLKFLIRLEYLDHLIRIKGTGSPKRLARKLNISERSTFAYIDLLKEIGAPIKYSRQRKTYYYEVEGNINFRFSKNK
jgi:biotin operon repressor